MSLKQKHENVSTEEFTHLTSIGYSPEEIASMLGISKTRVKSLSSELSILYDTFSGSWHPSHAGTPYFRWLNVYSDDDELYSLPDKPNERMACCLSGPAIYRWVIRDKLDIRHTRMYVGQTQNLYRRICFYAENLSKTSQKLIDYSTLNRDNVKLQRLSTKKNLLFEGSSEELVDLKNQSTRMFFESLIIAHHKNMGIELLNSDVAFRM